MPSPPSPPSRRGFAGGLALALLCGALTLELGSSGSTPGNTCPYAGDTVCDEPKFCPNATDCDDCTLVGRRHADCPLPPTPAPTPAPKTNTSVFGFAFLVPNHDDANFHGKALRVNLDDFSTTHVVDFQPSPKDAQGWPVACLTPNGARTYEGRCGLVGFVMGFKDLFGYAYYVPHRNNQNGIGERHGLLARVKMDSFDAVEFVDVAAQDPELVGFVGGYAAGQWGYLLPRYDGAKFAFKIARVNLQDFRTVQVLDLSLSKYGNSLTGFYGGFTTGSHGYIVPDNNVVGKFGAARATRLVRFNMGEFTPSAVDVLDLNSTAFSRDAVTGQADLGGFRGSFTVGEWAYLVPNNNGAPFGKLTRVNVLDFRRVQVVDLALLDARLRGFLGGFRYEPPFINSSGYPTAGEFAFLVPYKNNDPLHGDFHGLVVRVNLTEFEGLATQQAANQTSNFTAARPDYRASAVTVLDLRTLDDELRGFAGGFSHNGDGYLVPYYKGASAGASYASKFVKINLWPHFDIAHVTVLDLDRAPGGGAGPGLLKGYMFGFVGLGMYQVGLRPPEKVVYTENPALYTVGFAIRNNAPTYSGGLATYATITPALPAGLEFDQYSAVIYGKPTQMASRRVYNIEICNFAGCVSYTLSIKVGQGNFAYLVPYLNGKVTRLNLNDFRTTEVRDLAEVDPELRGFSAGFALLAWAYFVPNYDGEQHTSKVVRLSLDDFKKTEVLDLTKSSATHAASLRGFIFGFHVSTLGQDWGYLIPDYSCKTCDTAKGKLVRFGLEDFSSVHVLDLAAKDPDLMGFSGGFNIGNFLFLVPNYNSVYYGKLVRVNLMVQRFADAAVEVRDLREHDGRLKGFWGGFQFSVYGYLVPFYNGTAYHGLVARVQLASQDFSQSRVETFDLTTIDPDLVGFKGAFYQEENAFLVPYVHTKFVSFNAVSFDRTPEKVRVIDLKHTAPDLSGFVGGFVVGSSGYLVPHYNGAYFGKIVQVLLRTFTVNRVLDLDANDQGLRGFMGGFYYMRVSESHNYTENAFGVPVCQGIGLVDLDTSIVTNAEIRVDPIARGDVLELPQAKLLDGVPGDDLVVWLPDRNGIQGQYNGKESVLTLSGGATRDKYEDTLRSIIFWSTSEDPSSIPRTILFTVQGQLVYKVAVDVSSVNDFVTVEKLASKVMYVQGAPSTGIAGNLVIMDLEMLLQQQAEALQEQADSGADNSQLELFEMMMMMMMMMAGDIEFNLLSAKIFVVRNFDAAADMLMLSTDHAFLAENNVSTWEELGINVTYNASSGTLLMEGEASIQIYQSALRAVQYQSNSDDESTRTIQFSINDGTTEQVVAQMEIAAVSREVGIIVTNVHKHSSEAGGMASFHVLLTVEPKAPILLAITSSDSTEGVCEPTFAVVSKDNYAEGVSVTIIGQPDSLDDGDMPYVATVVPITTKDKDYLRHPPVDVPLLNADDPINKVRIKATTEAGGIFCTTSEAGLSCKFTLTTQDDAAKAHWHPSFKRLIIRMRTNNVHEGMLVAPDGSLVQALTKSLSVDTYQAGVQVEVKGVDDPFDDENVNYLIELDAQIELDYTDVLKTISPDKMTTNIVCTNEDDDTAGITINACPTKTTSEAGEPCPLTIRLNTQPLSPVIFTSWSNDETEGNVTSGRTLTIQPGDWNQDAIVMVGGVDDFEFDKTVTYTVFVTTESLDLAYSAKEFNFPLSNLDNDIADMVVKQGGKSLTGSALPVDETGLAQEFTVQLPNVPFYDVSIAVASSNTAEVTVSPPMIVFNEFNWMQPQTVTVTGIDDEAQDGDIGVKVTLSTASEDPKFDQIQWYFFMYNLDDDGLGFDKTTCNVYEAGTKCLLGLVLPRWQTDQFSSVVWQAQNANPDVVDMGSTHFEFAQADWSSPRLVNLSAVDNSIDSDDKPFAIRFDGQLTYTHHGGGTKGICAEGITFSGTSVNDDIAGVVFNYSRTGSVTDEAGTQSQFFTVSISSEPVEPVFIPIKSSDRGEGVTCWDRARCPGDFPDATPLRFDKGNWQTPQTVEVRGTQDDTFDGTQPFTQSIGPSTSEDAKYVGFKSSRDFVCTDDDVVGLNVTVLQKLSSEAGRYAVVLAALTSSPTAPVLFSISSLDASEGVPDPSIFVLSQQNWKTGTEIKCFGQPDLLDDGDREYTVAVTPITTEDPDYLQESPVYVQLLNLDDPVNRLNIGLSHTRCQTTEVQAGLAYKDCVIKVLPSYWHTEEGAYEKLTVTLTTNRPAEGLLVDVDAPAPAGGGVAHGEAAVSHTFTGATYAAGWSFRIRGVDDDVVDGNINYNVTMTAQITTDAAVRVKAISPLKMQGPIVSHNADNDFAGWSLTKSCNVTNEAGDFCTFFVSIDTQPYAAVHLEVTSDTLTEGKVTKNDKVTFTPQNWKQQVEIVVTGQDDDAFDGDIPYAITFGPTTSDDPLYNGFYRKFGFVNKDNDIAQLRVTQDQNQIRGLGKPVDETGDSVTFEVALPANANPTHSVTVDISSSNELEGTVDPSRIVFNAKDETKNSQFFVKVTGVDDDVADGNTQFRVSLNSMSDDPMFDNVQWYFLMRNIDDDGLQLSASACETSEQGKSCDVVLSLPPDMWRPQYTLLRFDVRQQIPDPARAGQFLGEPQYPPEAEVSKQTIEFDAQRLYSQTLRITGLDDSIDDGDMVYTIVLSGTLEYSHHGGGSKQTFARSITGRNIDDDVAGIVVYQSSNETREAGSCQPTINGLPTKIGMEHDDGYCEETPNDDDDTDCAYHCYAKSATLSSQVKVVLTSQPRYTVTIPITVENPGEGVAFPTVLTFTGSNWNVNQTVTIKGVNDYVMDYNVTYGVTVGPTASALDPSYRSGAYNETLTFFNVDDDFIGLAVAYVIDSEGMLKNKTSENGITVGQLTARLLSQPKSTVLFTVSTSNPREASVSPSILAFSGDDWNVAQTVSVQGEDDLYRDGDQAYQVEVKTVYTADPDYSSSVYGMLKSKLEFVNTDDKTDRAAGECEMGQYGVATPPSTCKPCPIGTYSDTTTNVTVVSDCKKCPKGTKGMAIEGGGTSLFRDGNIVPACEACPFGYKQPLAGMSYCQKCGRVAAADGVAAPVAAGAAGDDENKPYDPNNLGGWVYCPVATSWGSEIWRSKPEDYAAQTDIWYNDTDFTPMYKHEWEAPEQVEFQKAWKFMGQTFQLTELNLPYAVSAIGWLATAAIFAIIGTVRLLARWELISDARWEATAMFIKKKDYFEDEHSSDLEDGGSFLGGMTTILFMVWAYSLLGLTAYFFIAYNELVNQALVPKTEEDVKSLRPDIIIKVLFVGYTGPCLPNKFYAEAYPNAGFVPYAADPMKYNPSEAAPDFAAQGASSLGATDLQGKKRVISPSGMQPDFDMGGTEEFRTVCSHKPGEFMAEYKCNKCIITSASISFTLGCDGMWNTNPVSRAICNEHVISAQQISWKLHASAVIPQEDNGVYGRMVVLDRREAFRGARSSVIDISLIPAAFDDSVRQKSGKGYRVQYMLERQGDVAGQAQFLDGRENKVKFDMLLATDIVQLELKIVAKRTMMMAFAEAGGLFGAVAGLVIVLMNTLEVGQNVWSSITKRQDDSDSSSDSESDDVSSTSEESSSDDDDMDDDGSGGSGGGSGSDVSGVSGVSGTDYSSMGDSGTEGGASSGAESSVSTASRKNRRKSRLIDDDSDEEGSVASNVTADTGAGGTPGGGGGGGGKKKERKGSRMEDEPAAAGGEPAGEASGSFAARRRASRMLNKKAEAEPSGGESSAAPSGDDSDGASVVSGASRGSRPNRRKSRFVAGEEAPAAAAARAAAQAVLEETGGGGGGGGGGGEAAPAASAPARRKSRSGATRPAPGSAKRPGARRS